MSDNETLIEKKTGKEIGFTRSLSSGRSENHLGEGKMDISLQRNDGAGFWITIGDIRYSEPSQDALLEMETAPQHTNSYIAKYSHTRSLSSIQASYAMDKITNFINQEFQGRIPSDEEILKMKNLYEER